MDIPPPLELIGAESGESFLRWGRLVLGWMRTHADLSPDDAVLEVGCGPGYNAVPLAGFLSDRGSYHAFDPHRGKIAWCREHVGARRSNFTFEAIDLYNGLYNPSGTIKPAGFRFPYTDGRFDFVILTSIFTHFLPAEVDRYLGEIARVLRPGGRCYISYFLLNAEVLLLQNLGRGRRDLVFAHGLGGAVTDDPERLVAVAYDESFLRPLYVKHALRPREPFCYGSWCGRERYTVDNQDVVVADRL